MQHFVLWNLCRNFLKNCNPPRSTIQHHHLHSIQRLPRRRHGKVLRLSGASSSLYYLKAESREINRENITGWPPVTKPFSHTSCECWDGPTKIFRSWTSQPTPMLNKSFGVSTCNGVFASYHRTCLPQWCFSRPALGEEVTSWAQSN